jgi:hypothetical protein
MGAAARSGTTGSHDHHICRWPGRRRHQFELELQPVHSIEGDADIGAVPIQSDGQVPLCVADALQDGVSVGEQHLWRPRCVVPLVDEHPQRVT